MTIVESNDTGITDGSGNFSIEGPLVSGDIQVSVQRGTLNATVIVPNVSAEPTTISLDVQVSQSNTPMPSQVSSSNLEVVSKIVGSCDVFFENFRIIRQSNPTPPTVTCIVRSTLKGDGKTLGKVPITIQVRRCSAGSRWRTIAEGLTSSGTHSGVAQVPFTFIDDAKNCVYRVVAPAGVDGMKGVVYEIDTFTKQQFDAENK